jgi:hypothetical protein
VYWNKDRTEFRLRSGVDLEGDTGATLTIFVED